MARHDVLMPRLSDSMVDGVVIAWLKQPGDEVKHGEELVEIETDKVTTILDAEADGILLHVLYAAGEVAPTGAVLAVVASGADVHGPATADPVGEIDAAGVDGEAEATGPPIPVEPRAVTSLDLSQPPRVIATPLARRLARQLGIDLKAVDKGSGPSGRILRQDVEQAAQRLGGDLERGKPGSPATDFVVAASRVHRLTATRMAQSKREIPHYYLTTVVDMTPAKRSLGSAAPIASPVKISITDLVVWACAVALRDLPQVNATWQDDAIVQRGEVNIGVAVALENGDLVVPVVRGADTKQLSELSQEIRALADKARGGNLELKDLEKATFTVSSLGMFGVEEFHPIINPPQSAILGVGAIGKQLQLVEGGIEQREVMRISLSADHRVFSGATAAMFLNAVRNHLEHNAATVVSSSREDRRRSTK